MHLLFGFMKRDATSPSRWAPERRLEFIDFRLQWDRTINRGELTKFFGVSPQQASADLARYHEIAPGNLEYDRSGKTYRASQTFQSSIVEFDSQVYLDQLAGVTTGKLPEQSALIGWTPPCEVLRLPVRTVAASTLLHIHRAIREAGDLEIRYQSMRRSDSSSRWIAPHSLASDGLRWHVRAWCFESKVFKDFVLSRIQDVTSTRQREHVLPVDEAWETQLEIAILPRQGLSPSQRATTEAEYGMANGRLTLKCRKAMAFYLLRLLHLDSADKSVPLAQQPLEVEHSQALAEVIAAARKTQETSHTDDAPN
jgi:hypothetical protein